MQTSDTNVKTVDTWLLQNKQTVLVPSTLVHETPWNVLGNQTMMVVAHMTHNHTMWAICDPSTSLSSCKYDWCSHNINGCVVKASFKKYCNHVTDLSKLIWLNPFHITVGVNNCLWECCMVYTATSSVWVRHILIYHRNLILPSVLWVCMPCIHTFSRLHV